MNTPKLSDDPNRHSKSWVDEVKHNYRSERAKHKQTYDRLLYGAGPSTSAEKLQLRLFGVAFLLVGLIMGVGGILSVFVVKDHVLEFQVILICAAPILIGLGLIVIISGKSPLGKILLSKNRGETPPHVARTDSPSYAVLPNMLVTTENPMERFLILFSKRGVLLLVLLVVVGPVIALHLDERIATFLMGIIFTLSGVGQFVVARKDSGYFRYLGFVIGTFVLLLGVFLSISSVLMFIAGVPIHVSGA